MLKKLLWLGFFALVAFGVWKGAPWLISKYQQWQAKRTMEMQKQIKKSAEKLTAPARKNIDSRTQKVREKLNQIEKNQ